MKTKWNEGYEKGYADALEMLNLTDEEIQEIWLSFKGGFKDFARAILKKANKQ
jgi:hypothetical protein